MKNNFPLNLILTFRFTFTIVFLSVALHSSGSFASARFDELRIRDGLPSQTVWDVEQGHNGIIWLGTTHGLVRYDGGELKTFNFNADKPGTISNNTINDLLVTKSGDLWIGTYKGGLNLFNEDTETFTSFQHLADDKSSLSSNNVLSLEETANGDIWVGTRSGLNKVEAKTNKIITIKNSQQLDLSLPSQSISALLIDHLNKLWVGTSKGIIVYDEFNNQSAKFKLPVATQPSIRALYQSKNGSLWIGTESGLFHYDYDNEVTTYVAELPNNGILSITSDHQNNIWVGTRNNGVFTVSQDGLGQPKLKANYRYDKGSEYSLNDDVILSLFTDYSGVIWLGTFSAGVNRIDPNSLNFGFVDNSINGLQCLESPIIYSIFKEPDDSLWLGTRRGVAHISKDGNCIVYRYDSNNESSLSSDEVHKVYRDSRNQLWFATAKGINRYNEDSETFERIHGELSSVRVYDINETSSGKLLIASVKGLFVESSVANQFLSLTSPNKELNSLTVSKIIKSESDRFLIGTSKGLLEYHHSNGFFDYLHYQNEPLVTDYIRALYVDHADNIWIGLNEKGLIRIDQDLKIKRYNEEDGLPQINVFSGILEGQDDVLWISTGLNLIRFNPKTSAARKYTTNDGLQSDVFVRRAEFKANDGTLYFGGYNGFNHFSPSSILTNKVKPKVILTHFYHFGESIEPNIKTNKFSLPTPITRLKELKLSHKDNDFGFSFSALHFSDFSSNKYAYKMVGFDSDWRQTDSLDRKANYTNLKAGQYWFEVKAANKDNVWSEDNVRLKIIIAPAPWLTWWAFVLYLIFALLAVYWVIKKRTKALALRTQLLQETVTLRTQELVEEKSKVEQLLAKKNEEFANVSHEFRTPLTLILGPLAEVLKSDLDEKEIYRLNIVQRNGYRLLRMVDQLLNLETFRVKSITQRTSQPSGEILKMLAEAFSDLASDKGIALNIRNIEQASFDFTNDALEKIIANLLSNAIKYTPPGGFITVGSYRTSSSYLTIEVQDSGIGIPPQELESVFQRYHRILNENSEQVTGAGIGLALVKDLVEAHGGTIDVESEINSGTSIFVRLPIINEVKKSQEAYRTNQEIIAMELMGISHQITKASTPVNNEFIDNENNKPSVLVIEDNPDMRLFIIEQIQQEFQVLSAKDGQQGIEVAINAVPDIIISDIMMPNKDGFQVTNELRHHHITNHIPIILLTARGDRESRLKGWYEKADEYLTKPFDSQELTVRLHNLLGIRNLLKKRFSELAFETKSEHRQTPFMPSAESEEATSSSRAQEEFIRKLNSILEEHYSDSDLSVSTIASKLAMSDRQLYRKTKSIVDMTPIDYVRRFRIEKGRILIKQGKSAGYATVEIGFTSQSYFGKCFKAQFGMTPRDYKKTHTKKN